MTLGITYDTSRKPAEAQKVVISRSRRLILWQCLVHLVPILTSVTVLYVNYRGFYIGVNFPGMTDSDTVVLMLLQLSAKVHEIMIVASLSQVVWHAVRYQLLHGEGLPLGLIGSGISFSSFEFYFKKDFVGSLSYLSNVGQKLKRLGFVALVIVSGATGILSGPASAVLLVPKAGTYDAGGTKFYLNGSASQFWPEDLSGDLGELRALCSTKETALDDICPAGGFVSLWERWRGLNHLEPADSTVATFANDLSGSRFYWPVHSSTTRIPPLYTLGDRRSANDSVQPYTWLVQAHAASAIVLDRLTQDWWQALLATMKVRAPQVNDRNVKASSPSAYAAVRCGNPQNISSSTTTMSFPTIDGRWDWGRDLSFNVTAANLTQSQRLRFQWVHLPRQFGVVSIGGLLELPWTEAGDSRVVVGCSAQTGWIPTTLRTDAYTFWSGWYPYDIRFGERTPAWTAVGLDQVFTPTNGRIALGQTWLDLLTPDVSPIPGLTDQQPMSTIETILVAAGVGNTSIRLDNMTQAGAWARDDQITSNGKKRLLEAVIANVLADGLSRSGSHRVFQQQSENDSSTAISMYQPLSDFEQRVMKGSDALVAPQGDPSTFTVLSASMLISGYAFQSSLPASLAVVVLLAHAILALVHMVWLGFRGQVSRSWDSIAELVALAQNSQPARTVLENTGAGIELRRTHAAMARIRVRSRSSDEQNDHVELVFEDDAHRAELKVAAESSDDLIALRPLRDSSMDHTEEQNLTQKSWTFPLNNGGDNSKRSAHSYINSSSTEQLLLRRRAHSVARELVQTGRKYS